MLSLDSRISIDKTASLVQNIIINAGKNSQNTFAKIILNKTGEFINISFEELISESSRFANLFLQNNVKRKETVIIILKHSPELLFSFIGALMIGAIPSIFSHPSVKISFENYIKSLPKLIKYSGSFILELVTTKK